MPTLDKDTVLNACAGKWLDFYAPYTDLHREGSEFVGACPIHQGANRKNFKVNPDTGQWYCHSGCQEGGDVFTFLEKTEGLRFGDALLRLAQWAGMSVPDAGARNAFVPVRKPPAPIAPPAPPVLLDPALAQQAHDRLMNTPKMVDWLLTYRRWTQETLVHFQVGLDQQAEDKAAGVYRITFPVFDAEGRLTNLRRHLFAYKDDITEERRRELSKSKPWQKGLTPGLFPMSALKETQEVLLVGGEPDALLANQLGLPAVTGTSGEGTWKAEWTEALACHCVTVLYDRDEAGKKGAKKAADALHAAGVCVSVARYPEGVKDLTEWVVTQGASADDLRRVIADALPFATSPALSPHEATPSTNIADWEPLLPFAASSLPPFPVEALPPVARDYVDEIVKTTVTDATMSAVLMLGILGAAGGRRCMVQVGQTHTEPLNLYCVVVAEPGGRKSGVLPAVDFPLRDYEATLVQSSYMDIAAAKARRTTEEKRLEHLQNTAAKDKEASRREELTREAELLARDLTPVPSAPVLVVDNFTPERLTGIMLENDGAAAVVSPEGGIFTIMAGRYSNKEVDIDLILKGHAGDSVRVDRVGRPSEFIKRPALSIAIGVQPNVLASLNDTPAFRGRGLLGRFLYGLPRDMAGNQPYSARAIDPDVRRRYARAIERILDLPSAGTEEDPTLRHSLLLTGDALTLWAKHHNAIDERKAAGEDLAGVRDWASKLPGVIARIAGNFHLLEHAGGDWQKPISVETVAAAAAVAEFLIPHALAAFGHMRADPVQALAERVLGWIERKGLTAFTLRECQQAHKGGQALLTAEELMPALNALAERGYIRATSGRQGTGGRPGSPSYTVNPATHDAAKRIADV